MHLNPFKKRVQNPTTTTIEPIDPLLAALCGDIQAHPEDYQNLPDNKGIYSFSNPKLWIIAYYGLSCFSASSNQSERALIAATARRFSEHQQSRRRAELREGLAEVIARRTGDWTDTAGKRHRTRAEMREANRKTRRATQSLNGT